MDNRRSLVEFERALLEITSNELVAAKFKMGMLLNHCVGVYQLPAAEVEAYKRDIIDVLERIK